VIGHQEVLEKGGAVAAVLGRQRGKERNGVARLKDGAQLIDGSGPGQIDFGNTDGAARQALRFEKLHESARKKAIGTQDNSSTYGH
jgi:hypothetical protein